MRYDAEILMLAAGKSRRLGRAKQFVEYQEKPLILNTYNKLSPLTDRPINIAIRPQDAEKISTIFQKETINLIKINSTGIGETISKSVDFIKPKHPLLISVCDQPLIPRLHYKKLLRQFSSDPNRPCATDIGSYSVPAIFPTRLLPELIRLSGDQGAKSILVQNKAQSVSCYEAIFDIDKPTDLVNLSTRNQDD